jgi:hypothetical protein
MTATWPVVRDTVGRHRRVWLAITLGLAPVYYVGLVASVVIRLGHLPNYTTFYDWPTNVLRIIRATPSVHDMVPIILDEWLVEIGYMNYHYGRGVAEWSLAIIPSRVAVMVLLSALVATSVLLLARSRAYCRLPTQGVGIAATGLGAVVVGIANVTMTWVACCAAPSWVVGLSLIGLETSSAFALLPYGNALSVAGFAVLLVTTYFFARRCVPRPIPGVLPRQLVTQDR